MILNGLSLDAVLDALADRVAAKVRSELQQAVPNSNLNPRLLSVQQAAEYLGRSKAAVQHMVADGALPTVRMDRRVFLDRQDLDQWIERRKQQV